MAWDIFSTPQNGAKDEWDGTPNREQMEESISLPPCGHSAPISYQFEHSHIAVSLGEVFGCKWFSLIVEEREGERLITISKID